MGKEIIGTCQLLIVDRTRDITNEVTSGTRLNQVSRPEPNSGTALAPPNLETMAAPLDEP